MLAASLPALTKATFVLYNLEGGLKRRAVNVDNPMAFSENVLKSWQHWVGL